MTRRLTVTLAALAVLTVACDIDQTPAYGPDASETYTDGGVDALDTSVDAPDGLPWRPSVTAVSGGPEPPPDPRPSVAARPSGPVTVVTLPFPQPRTVFVPTAAKTSAGSTLVPDIQTVEPPATAPIAAPVPAATADTRSADAPEPFDGESHDSRLYWGPKGKRFAVMHATFEGGGSGYTDVEGKLVRLRDGAVRHRRVIASAAAAEANAEDEVDPNAVRRAKAFDARVTKKGYTLASQVDTERVESDEESERPKVAVSEGPRAGLILEIEQLDDTRLRIWARSPGKRRYSLGITHLQMEECWEMDHPDEVDIYPHATRRGNSLCLPGEPQFGPIWVHPGGNHVVVEVWASPGFGCRTDTYARLHVGRLR